jgi:hypothetical protein
MSADRLARVAELVRSGASVEDVMKEEGVGERQALRLMKLVRDAAQ